MSILNNNCLVKTIYDYESTDEKILNCKVGDIFLILKAGNETEWFYAIDSQARLGYIPANYTEIIQLNLNEYLQLVKNILFLLESSNLKNTTISKRQINHAQVKLTQLRCELVEKLNKNISGSLINKECISQKLTECKNSLIKENLEKDDNLNDEKKNLVVQEFSSNNSQYQLLFEKLTLELLEKVRLSTNLNYNVCKLTLKNLIECLKQHLPTWNDECNLILSNISFSDQISSEFIKTSADYLELKNLFNKLWFCKNDDQQRSWPIQEDEEQIRCLLSTLVNILKNANPKISKEVICEKNCENISLLITYFQMENRVALKIKLYSALLQTIRLVPNSISEIMLPSVLTGTLCSEMTNYKMDLKRWTLASKLFTAIFSTGHKPPINIYEYINEQFINSLLDLVEEPKPKGELYISPELSIPPILAFNLHFDSEDDYNYVINSLRNRTNVSHLLENLVSYLNFEFDPTSIDSILNDLDNKNKNNTYEITLENNQKMVSQKKQNAVHKLLIEMFEDEIIAKLFYYNDICVLVDILITFLNNLHNEDQNRLIYLKLFLRVCQNTNYKDEPHKLREILKCFKGILNYDLSSETEKKLAEMIIEFFI